MEEKTCGQCEHCHPVYYCNGDCECTAKSEPQVGFFFEVSEDDEIEWYGENEPCSNFEEVNKMDVKQFFKKDLRGVKIMSQVGYGDLIFFDNPDQLEVNERQTKLWKAKDGVLKRVDCVLYSVRINGQVYAEYESKEHVIHEIKKLAEYARKGDEHLTGLKCFKFSHECELVNRERLAAKGITNPQTRRG